MPKIPDYPDTPLGRAARELGGWTALTDAINELECRPVPRRPSSIQRMAQGEYPTPVDIAILAERVSRGACVAADVHPWLSGLRLRRAAA